MTPINDPLVAGDLVCAGDDSLQPRVSIVTTVYDRVACLEKCLRSVRGLYYQEYEHIIVSDAPPLPVVETIASMVNLSCDGRTRYVNLAERHNNWGITPAAVGLRMTRGDYVAFLSDDNGYTPNRFDKLVKVLDRDQSLGFVYTSCHYGGKLVLNSSRPALMCIDLGQPLFRRELFRAHLQDDLPFEAHQWDWQMIETFLKRNVQWKHIDIPSFIFRLDRYPQLAV